MVYSIVEIYLVILVSSMVDLCLGTTLVRLLLAARVDVDDRAYRSMFNFNKWEESNLA